MTSEGKQNSVGIQQTLNKRIETFRFKNKKLLQTLQKQQRKQRLTKQCDISVQNIMKCKTSQKYIGQKPHQYETQRHEQQNPYNLKVVKLPLSKLVPLTIQKYRQKIRML